MVECSFTDSSRLDVALDLADRGWAVFPCHTLAAPGRCSCGKPDCRNVAKHPRTANGLKDATDNEEQIRAWWSEHPDSNVAIATGSISGLWVLDLDQKGYGPEEFERFRAGRELEATVIRTGGGGAHLYFATDSDVEVRNRAGILSGVDVRGDGGYVIAAGSVHASGVEYTWATDDELRAAPAWLLELAVGEKQRRVVTPDHPVEVVPLDKGQVDDIQSALGRIDADDRAAWLAVGMALHSTDAGEQAFELWTSWSKTSAKFSAKDQAYTWAHFAKRNDDEVGLGTLFHLAKSSGWVAPQRTVSVAGVAVEMGDVWAASPETIVSVEAETPFPIDNAFPVEWARDFAQSIAHVYQVPVDMPAMLLLPILSACMAKKYVISPTDGWRENTALWCAVAMRSGERKSAVMGEVLRPLNAWERDRTKAQASVVAEWEQNVQIARKAVSIANDKAAGGKAGGESEAKTLMEALQVVEAQKPQGHSVTATEPTTESLAKLLQDNHERYLVASPEADPLDMALGRYSNGDPNLGVWLAGHAGDTYKVTRRTRDADMLEAPALSLAITPQPQAMRSLFGSAQALERGFVARFLFSVPTSTMGQRKLVRAGVDESLRGYWTKATQWLLDLEVPEEASVVRLSPEALDRFESFWVELEATFVHGGRSAAMRSWYAKLAGAVLRIALALHGLVLPWKPTNEMIDLDAIERALAWVPYLEAQLRRALGEVTEDPDAHLAERILSWLATEHPEGGEFSRRDAYRQVRGSSGITTTKQVDVPLSLLIDAGWLREIRTGKARPGRPTARFSSHPRLGELVFGNNS